MGIVSTLLGGGKTSSQQTQNSDSFGYSLNGSNSSSVSGGSSRGGSLGLSGSSQGVFAEDIFRQLFSGASAAAGAIDPALATSRVNQLFTGGAGIIDQLSGGGAGTAYLNKRLSGDNNDILNAQIDAVGSDLGRFYKEELNPAIVGSSVAGGALGGGRQGVAEGIATGNVLEQFAKQSASLRAADVAQRDTAALGLLDAQGKNAGTALGALPGLAKLGDGTEALAPYSALSNILGGPTTLTESFGQEQSSQESEQYAQSIADEFGISYDEAHALLTASSKGKTSGGLLPALSGFAGGGRG